jgi:uridine kinase
MQPYALEKNCSVGKGRRSREDLNGFVTAVDERVERCGGGKEPFLIGVAGGRGCHDPIFIFI